MSADSTVLIALNTLMITAEDFVKAGQLVALTQRGRSGFFGHTKRMNQLVTHPVFGYRIPRIPLGALATLAAAL